MTDSTDNKEEKVFEFDRLQIFCGLPYKIHTNNENSVITIIQPKVRDIVNIGEKEFYSTLYTFVGNTTMYRLNLWKVGVDWNDITDYELFCMFIKSINSNIAKLLFAEDIDFESFELYQKKINEDEEPQTTLYSEKMHLEISEDIYKEIREYLRLMFNVYPKIEFATNKATKLAIIREEEDNIRYEKFHNKNPNKSTLQPLISFALNHPGFKYNLEQLLDIGIYQFMDAVQRLQVYESTRAMFSGMYSGFADFSKTDKNLFNFARDLDTKE